MNDLTKISSNPHTRSKITTGNIMLTVIAALLPATLFGIYNFGISALILILVTVGSAVLSEYLYEKLMKQKSTVHDLSAVVTGLLLALNLPPAAPWWIGVVGGSFAIIVVKMLFGGIGQNFMNPALAARCFLMISFASIMTNFECDAYSQATPLATLKSGGVVDIFSMVTGKIPGTIGETSMIAIVLGVCILILTGVIDLKIPGSYLISFVIFISLFGGRGFDYQYISAHLAGGGLMLGAFFMATDYATRPITANGQILYGILLGVLTGMFRLFGGSAEGVSYAIIISNLLVPLIEKITMPKGFGAIPKGFGSGGLKHEKNVA
ncbi:MAG: RnfABCDGE type electron transport complex subunit D [Lachnospiraceae bacterium]|nr:RnfABCDGE type electron transport complex subunit D [Lachnospiraceae bacterium]MDD3660424.1 RnfABCDGE type electron transport complex subunit D [Lachnospiraceae bacterium]